LLSLESDAFGATTFGITTLGVMTFRTKTLTLMQLSILTLNTTLCKMTASLTSVRMLKGNKQHSVLIFIVMLIVSCYLTHMLRVIMLSDVMLCGIHLGVVMPIGFVLIAIMSSVILMSVLPALHNTRPNVTTLLPLSVLYTDCFPHNVMVPMLVY
jgi:hypothetical protein